MSLIIKSVVVLFISLIISLPFSEAKGNNSRSATNESTAGSAIERDRLEIEKEKLKMESEMGRDKMKMESENSLYSKLQFYVVAVGSLLAILIFGRDNRAKCIDTLIRLEDEYKKHIKFLIMLEEEYENMIKPVLISEKTTWPGQQNRAAQVKHVNYYNTLVPQNNKPAHYDEIINDLDAVLRHFYICLQARDQGVFDIRVMDGSYGYYLKKFVDKNNYQELAEFIHYYWPSIENWADEVIWLNDDRFKKPCFRSPSKYIRKWL
jgi:hypothetical protein